MLGRRAGDAARDDAPNSNLTVSSDEVIELARRVGRNGDPEVRQLLARLVSYVETGKWNALRSRAEAKRGGGEALASIGKLAQTRIVKLGAELGIDMLGAGGMLDAPDGVDNGRFTLSFVFSPASSIYGGSDEIQRNIIGERVLGLPREPAPDKGVPFAEVLRNVNPDRRSG
jgi:alkylation response protein AidB-like acyl-CoA dehydrogenase